MTALQTSSSQRAREDALEHVWTSPERRPSMRQPSGPRPRPRRWLTRSDRERERQARTIEWAKARFGRFALANGVGQRAKQLIAVWGGHWKPNGGGLLEQALSDIVEGRAKLARPSAGLVASRRGGQNDVPGHALTNHDTCGVDVKS